mgnify:FL=1
MKETTKCIRCLKKAEIYCGHVTTDRGHTIQAGWCGYCFKGHSRYLDLAKRQGCYGGWLKRYGVKEVA